MNKAKEKILNEYKELVRVALGLEDDEVEIAGSLCSEALDAIRDKTLEEIKKYFVKESSLKDKKIMEKYLERVILSLKNEPRT